MPSRIFLVRDGEVLRVSKQCEAHARYLKKNLYSQTCISSIRLSMICHKLDKNVRPHCTWHKSYAFFIGVSDFISRIFAYFGALLKSDVTIARNNSDFHLNFNSKGRKCYNQCASYPQMVWEPIRVHRRHSDLAKVSTMVV